MKERASADGGCWKVQSIRLHQDGRKLETVRIADSPAALRAEIAEAGERPRVVVEATYGWYWAADVLEKAGAEVAWVVRGLAGSARCEEWQDRARSGAAPT